MEAVAQTPPETDMSPIEREILSKLHKPGFTFWFPEIKLSNPQPKQLFCSNMKIPTLTDYPLCIGKILDRRELRHSQWIRRQLRREKWRTVWLVLGLILSLAALYFIWRAPLSEPNPQGPVDPIHADNPLNRWSWNLFDSC